MIDDFVVWQALGGEFLGSCVISFSLWRSMVFTVGNTLCTLFASFRRDFRFFDSLDIWLLGLAVNVKVV